jgi:ABC-type oligopeptide transport system substrate-binding subunit
LHKGKVLLGTAVVLAVGLTAAAGTAGAAAKRGGVAHFSGQNDIDFSDPALDYLSSGWNLEYSTCVKLINYPDKTGAVGSQPIAEAAQALPTVSKDGKTYTFVVPPGKFKFSPPSNQPVTAKTFSFVIDRLANPKMQSPAQPFLSDIVGAQAVIDSTSGNPKHVSGVTVSGNKLIIKLTAPHPDFLSRIAMPFFCAVPTNTALDPNGVNTPSAAGPYYIASRTVKRQIVLKRNPNYHGPRPANLDQIIYTFGVDPNATLLAIKANQADWAVDGVPPAAYSDLWDQYGPTSKAGKAGKEQFFVNAQLGTSYLAMNTSRSLFGSANARKAINFAIDRPNYLRQGGAYAGKVTDQILPPGVNGYKPVSTYPLKAPDIAKAKSLGGGLAGQTMVLYTSNSPTANLRAQIIQADMQAIGLKTDVKVFARATQIQKEGTKGEPFDMTTEGWIADYADPYDFINILLSGDSIHASNNNNVAYFNDPGFNAKMLAASKLFGSARTAAYAKLDADITNNAAPWAATHNFLERDFFSARIGGQIYQPTYGMSLGALYVR